MLDYPHVVAIAVTVRDRDVGKLSFSSSAASNSKRGGSSGMNSTATSSGTNTPEYYATYGSRGDAEKRPRIRAIMLQWAPPMRHQE